MVVSFKPKFLNCALVKNHIALNCIMHMLLLFAILSGVFIFVIGPTAEKAFKSEFDELGPILYDKLVKYDNPILKQAVRVLPLDRAAVLYSVPDRAVKSHNNWIKVTMLLIVLILFAVIVMMWLGCCMCFPMGKVLAENLIIFAFVGLVEFGFFWFIARKYVPTAPSLMVDTVFDTAEQHLTE